MYPTSGATIRGDLNGTVVEEAARVDDMFIGSQCCPPIPVDAKSGSYPKITTAPGELLERGQTIRTPSGSYGRVSRSWTYDTYDCVDRGLEEPVDDTVTRDLSRFFDYERRAAILTLRNVKMDHEARVSALLMNASTFSDAANSAVAYTAANIATINFALDVLTAIERCAAKGCQANTIIMSSQVLHRIAPGTLTQNWVRGSLSGNIDMPVNAANLARSFADYGIQRVLVGRARYNTAKKGQAVSLSAVWGYTYVWVGDCNPGATMLTDAGAAATLVWNQEGGLWVTESYRQEELRSTIIRVRQNTTEKIIDSTKGTLITTQYS